MITDICEVCYWQYDEVSQNNPSKSIGPNNVSLVQARENYKKIGAIEERFIEFVRKPNASEI
ncbi:MAG: glycosyltransferase [Clostridia bacterium]|nr:glycosyltransferase [Clostridia bacterium]